MAASGMSKRTEPDWNEIRNLLEEGESVSKLAKRFNINPSTVYRRRKAWQQTKQAAKADGAEINHQTMVQRLYQAAERQITHLELKLISGEAAFDDKEARMLGTIARTLDKLLDLSASKKEKSETNEQIDSQGDLDRLRQELASRLEKLQP